MAHSTRGLLTGLLLAALLPAPRGVFRAASAPVARAGAQEEPVPVPFIEREEVRFVTLDIVAEEKARGWRPLRGLTVARIEVRVGGRLMPIDQFEDHCSAGPELEPPVAPDATSVSPTPGDATSSFPGSPALPDSDVNIERPPAAAGPHRYILYFDLEHLELAGRDAAFKAALSWADGRIEPVDEVMILTGGRGIRIVRTFLPAADHLRQDLEAAKADFSATELWGALEWLRLWELGQEKNRTVRRMQAESYARIDRSKTSNALANLRDVMTIFDSVEGTKNLVLFADTIRLLPGRQYGVPATRLTNLHTELQDLAEAANERNVRIYPVKAGLWVPGGGGDPLADDALTMLASETGGRVFEGSNEVDGAFDRVGEDLSCYYRVGFRVRPRYSGRVEPIRVRLLDRPGAVRLRYRQTLEDPTREELDADMIRAAFMAPSAARAFPIAVRATTLFRQDGGARLQIEVGTPLGELLGLPLPGGRRGARQLRVEIGARIVPLRPLEDDAVTVSSRRGVWADVATDRPSSGFGRQAVLTLPPLSDPDHTADRMVSTGEFDAPPGRYRIVAVVQDQQARTIAAATTEFEVGVDTPRLGPIGLASSDAHAVRLSEPPAGTADREASVRDAADWGTSDRESASWNGEELAAARPLLPSGALMSETSVVEAGSAVHFIYSVCMEPTGNGRPSRHPGPSYSNGWDVERILTCGPGNRAVRLPPRSWPSDRRGPSCVPLIDSIPADALEPGRCRFDVLLSTPGGELESAVREFSVVPSPRRAAG